MTIEIFNNTVRSRTVINKLGYTIAVNPAEFRPKALLIVRKPRALWSEEDHSAYNIFNASIDALALLDVAEAALVSAVTSRYM